jgi:hypothetical protein
MLFSARIVIVLFGSVLIIAGLVSLSLCLLNYFNGGIRPFSWRIYFDVNRDALLGSMLTVPGVILLRYGLARHK